MLKELFDAIGEQASEADGVRVSAIPGDPRQVIVSQAGKNERFLVPPPVRSHRVDMLSDFIDAANHWSAEPELLVVFHNDSELVAVVDDCDRRDRVTLHLEHTDVFTTVGTLGSKTFDHKQFMRLLKHDLAGAVPDGLLPKIRKVEVASGGVQSADRQHGRERGTREFQAELANAAEIPEVVTVTCSVYRNPGLLRSIAIRCSLDVDVNALTFRLCPLPDEIRSAIDDAQFAIHEKLTAGIHGAVYQGSP